MYSYRTHIRGIVDELVDNAIKAKADKIGVKIELVDEFIAITVNDNGIGIQPEKLESIEKKLCQPRRAELEEYYGSLTTGVTAMGRGLAMVGMMSDEAHINSVPGEGTEIQVKLKLESGR